MAVLTELPAGVTAASHGLLTRVEVLDSGVVTETLDAVISGSVTKDASSAARGRVDLTIAGNSDLIPTGPDSLLAPYGNELQVYRGVGDNLVSLGIFRIDSAHTSSDTDGRQILLSGTDRAGRFIDDTFESAGQVDADTEATTAILDVLQASWPDFDYDFASVTAPLPAVAYDEGEDRWAFAQGIATAIGGELYFNAAGVLVLRPVPTAVSGNPVAYFQEGAGGVLLSAEREIDRDQVFNRVTVTGQNASNDPDADVPRGVAIDDNSLSPTYYYGKFGRKNRPAWFSEFISTDTQAADAAAGILARTIGAPDVISFSAIPDPARAPSDVVRITRADLGIDEDHLLDQVTISLEPGGEMTAVTRVTQTISS